MCATNQGFYGPVRSGFHQVLPLAPQSATMTITTAPEHDAMWKWAGADRGFMPVSLLEFNRPAHSPWLTVPLAEEEIVIQDANEAEVFRFDHNEAMEYAREMGLPTEFPL